MKKYILRSYSSALHGFTLIELLVVISIIAVLSALLMANFVGIRQRGRDAQRKSDLRQIQSALELYRADQGSYPNTLPNCGGTFEDPNATITYMTSVPCDPLSSSNSYTYASDGSTYSLYACLENGGDSESDSNNGRASQTCDSQYEDSYTLYNP